MILQNLIVQCSTLLLGIIAGNIVSWLAQEELGLYQAIIGTVSRITFVLTLLLPLLFNRNYIIIGMIALTYCILGIWQQKEMQVFFWTAPLSAILCSSTQKGFFTILACIFIATILSTTILFTTSKKVQWNKEIVLSAATLYLPFIIISALGYALLSQNYINF